MSISTDKTKKLQSLMNWVDAFCVDFPSENKRLYAKVLQTIEDENLSGDLASCSVLDIVNKDVILVMFNSIEDHQYFLSKKKEVIQNAFREFYNLPVVIQTGSYEELLIDVQETLDTLNVEVAGLTTDQQKALSKLKSFDRLFRLQGYAGTGKSYLICEYIKWLKSRNVSYVAACPTNKAAKNLRIIAAEAGLDLEVKTVAQLLGQQPELNETTGKEEFVSNGSKHFENYRVIIIDEFSMVNRENFTEIINEARIHNCQVLFVGDPAQLPPVKEKEPMAAIYDMSEATLNQIVRYDGDIVRIAEAIRTNPILPSFNTTVDKTIVCLSKDEWLKSAIALFESEEFQENSDHVRFLAWRNKTVEALNNHVRLHLWGESASPYVPGDRLIACKPLFRPKPGAKGKGKWRIFINNSEEAIVTQAGTLTELKFARDIYKYWEVLIRSDIESKEQKLLILHEDSKEFHAKKVKEYANRKQWSSYFDLSRMFDDVGYAYALTVHKAQGSSIENVFLDVDDMRGSSDRQKLLYTALTRTKKQAFILS